MEKVKQDKEDFEKGLQRFQALRSVFSQQTNILFAHLGMDALKIEVKNTRDRHGQRPNSPRACAMR